MSDEEEVPIGRDTGEIVQFPREHMRPEVLAAELPKREMQGKAIYAQALAGKCIAEMVELCAQHNIDIWTDDFDRAFAYISEAMKAIFYSEVGLKHPLHKTFNAAYKEQNEDGSESWVFPGRVKRARKLMINEVLEIDVEKKPESANTANTLTT